MKKIENELFKKGFNFIAGVDEVGRGCWAGPLVVAICCFQKEYENPKIKDSKKLNHKQRLEIFKEIKNEALFFDYVIYDANFVDQNNPKKTSIIGMEFLINKHKDKFDFALSDAEKLNLNSIPYQAIIKGDEKSQAIAAASIIAKIIRDQIMFEIDLKYPQFDFKSNKGYGTIKHRNALDKYGPIKNIHRFSYKPIKMLKNKSFYS